jgi:hypothetical protein
MPLTHDEAFLEDICDRPEDDTTQRSPDEGVFAGGRHQAGRLSYVE